MPYLAVATKVRTEYSAAAALQDAGFEVYLPLCWVEDRHGIHRSKLSRPRLDQAPLFDRIVFFAYPGDRWIEVTRDWQYKIAGILDVYRQIGSENPGLVPDRYVREWKEAEEDGAIWPKGTKARRKADAYRPEVGDRARVIDHGFAGGFEGTVVRSEIRRRQAILEVLGRRLNVKFEQLAPID